MANTTNTRNLSSINESDLERLEQLLSSLKKDAQDAHDNDAVFMHTVYVRLISIVSPIVVGTHARMEREHLASQRKQLKALKESQSSSNGHQS